MGCRACSSQGEGVSSTDWNQKIQILLHGVMCFRLAIRANIPHTVAHVESANRLKDPLPYRFDHG